MFVERLLNDGSAPLLEQVVKFSAERQTLILDNIANVDVPGYRQKDLSIRAFQKMLRRQVDRRRSGENADFEQVGEYLTAEGGGILSHDRNNRSMESMATELAKNGLMHNMAIEMLRKQYQQLEMALKERVV